MKIERLSKNELFKDILNCRNIKIAKTLVFSISYENISIFVIILFILICFVSTFFRLGHQNGLVEVLQFHLSSFLKNCLIENTLLTDIEQILIDID